MSREYHTDSENLERIARALERIADALEHTEDARSVRNSLDRLADAVDGKALVVVTYEGER